MHERRVIGQEAIGVGARHPDVARSQTSLLSQSVTEENDGQFAVEVSCRAIVLPCYGLSDLLVTHFSVFAGHKVMCIPVVCLLLASLWSSLAAPWIDNGSRVPRGRSLSYLTLCYLLDVVYWLDCWKRVALNVCTKLTNMSSSLSGCVIIFRSRVITAPESSGACKQCCSFSYLRTQSYMRNAAVCTK
jgi:hypothetical protein